jgi:hypothetical protein
MPLDGLNYRIKPHRPLGDLLESLGIEQVDQEVFEEHKRSQVAANPSNFLYRHRKKVEFFQALLAMGLLGGMAFLIAYCVQFGHRSIGIWAVSAVGLDGFALMMVMGLKARGPARWKETVVYHLGTVPMPIRTLAEEIRTKSRGSVSFVIGTLQQEQIILDPYLCVIAYDPMHDIRETYCLGIWDDDRIIHIAERH